MVRSGIALYGIHPSRVTPLPADFKPALVWKTLVAQVKRLPQGHFVGDSNTYRTRDASWIAVLPVGFSDGFRRGPFRWPHVLIRGEYAPLIGQVSMDLAVADVTGIEGVQAGEEVVLLGEQGRRAITVEDVAEQLETSVYEVVSTVLPREPRIS